MPCHIVFYLNRHGEYIWWIWEEARGFKCNTIVSSTRFFEEHHMWFFQWVSTWPRWVWISLQGMTSFTPHIKCYQTAFNDRDMCMLWRDVLTYNTGSSSEWENHCCEEAFWNTSKRGDVSEWGQLSYGDQAPKRGTFCRLLCRIKMGSDRATKWDWEAYFCRNA